MRVTPVACAMFALSACATASKFTIENRLEDLGLSSSRAACMADGLERRLTSSELRDFAIFTVQIEREPNPVALVNALSGIADEKIAGAVLASATSCVLFG